MSHPVHDHGVMGHGDMSHGDMGHGPMCSMNMLFTWDTTNLCIVFRGWRVSSTATLLLSLVAVLALGIGYEALREISRRYDAALARRAALTGPVASGESSPLIAAPLRWIGAGAGAGRSARDRAHLLRAVLYGLQNFYALMLMLIFMTYNGWIMLAVAFGAFLGFFLFGTAAPATKANACH